MRISSRPAGRCRTCFACARSSSARRRTSSGYATAWQALAEECAVDSARFRSEWLARAAREVFDEVNDLIDRHNRWYPAESRLPMDPRRRDYALVNGRDYRLPPLDADWVLERFPAELSSARSPRPDQRVDCVALLAADVAQHALGLLDLEAGELVRDVVGRVEDRRIARPAHTVGEVRRVVPDEDERAAWCEGRRGAVEDATPLGRGMWR